MPRGFILSSVGPDGEGADLNLLRSKHFAPELKEINKAIAKYKTDKGSFPESMDNLVPDYAGPNAAKYYRLVKNGANVVPEISDGRGNYVNAGTVDKIDDVVWCGYIR